MFAEMPRDNRTVGKIHALAAAFGFAGAFEPFGTSPPTKRFNISRRMSVL
jgi:hypothetical protein